MRRGDSLHHDPAAVPDGFTETSKTECDHVRPCLVADALDKLDDEAESEEGGEEGIRTERWVITVECAFDGALDWDALVVDNLADLSAGVWVRRWDRHGVDERRRCSIRGSEVDRGVVE